MARPMDMGTEYQGPDPTQYPAVIPTGEREFYYVETPEQYKAWKEGKPFEKLPSLQATEKAQQILNNTPRYDKGQGMGMVENARANNPFRNQGTDQPAQGQGNMPNYFEQPAFAGQGTGQGRGITPPSGPPSGPPSRMGSPFEAPAFGAPGAGPPGAGRVPMAPAGGSDRPGMPPGSQGPGEFGRPDMPGQRPPEAWMNPGMNPALNRSADNVPSTPLIIPPGPGNTAGLPGQPGNPNVPQSFGNGQFGNNVNRNDVNAALNFMNQPQQLGGMQMPYQGGTPYANPIGLPAPNQGIYGPPDPRLNGMPQRDLSMPTSMAWDTWANGLR